MSRVLSRRAALGGASTALAAGAVGLFAPGAAAAGTADAELVALGAAFDAALADYEAYAPISEAVGYTADRRLAELAGGLVSTAPIELWERAWAETGYNAAAAQLDALIDAVNDAARAIRDAPAATLAGFAIKAHAAWWDTAFALDGVQGAMPDERADLVGLFAAMEKAAGLPSLWSRGT